MHRDSSPVFAAALVGIAAFALVPAWTAAADAVAAAAVRTTAQIEADWLRQDVVRKLAPSPRNRPDAAQPSVATHQDAAGGCDGVKNGTYGFHTDTQANPWWQVDLGQPLPLERIVIYNRCDGQVGNRAAHLKVLVSRDGKQWLPRYQHDGTEFRGHPDGKPLVVSLTDCTARFVRIEIPERQYLHLDEIEVYRAGSPENVALHRPAEQSSTSSWSTAKTVVPVDGPLTTRTVQSASAEHEYAVGEVVQRGLRLGEDLRRLGANVEADEQTLREIEQSIAAGAPSEAAARRALYFKARWAVRRMAFANPLLDFEHLIFVKRAPGTFTHMSDQNYGWWSRLGGGLYVMENFKSDQPRLRCLSTQLPPGSVLSPDLSYDGTKIVFSHCKYYPGLREEPDKLNKANVPEDAFYHLYEVNLDGSGLRRLTRGKYDDFDGRYLPNGEIVLLSTRRGQFIQCGKVSSLECLDGALPDSYVRCGGGPERPVAVYTLHVIDADGGNLRQISPFEMFEWTPNIDHEGRILYARWDYVDRWNMPFMSLWSTMPDGTNAQAVFKNYTQNPHCVFEPRAIPGSRKLVFTASGHHANTGGSLVLLDPAHGADGDHPMTRLTPEVCFPETEGWPKSYFVGPYPLSEVHYLTAWSDQEMIGWPGPPEPVNATGLYLFDALGNLNLIYRDPAMSSMAPIPVRARPRPHALSSQVAWEEKQEGCMLLLDVYEGLPTIPRGSIERLRLVGVPVKTHPTMNFPALGLTHDDPGKFVLGTVPVEADGSAYFRVPSGVTLFLQALDREGNAVQTMRSATYVQPGQTYTCVGCHEPRGQSPPNRYAQAMRREPSRIVPGPQGSWPFSFASLVQPVLDQHCASCHKPAGTAAKFDLTPARAYTSLVAYGKPSLQEHVMARYQEGRSIPGAGAAQTSVLLKYLKQGHYDVRLDADGWQRFIVWMDTYGQREGSFGPDQERRLQALRDSMQPMLAEQPTR